MGSEKRTAGGKRGGGRRAAVRLKDVAEYLNLSPATVSLVLNRSPVAESIPPETQERVFAAAVELDYRPNFLARSLRSRRTFSIGVLVPEISEGYAAGVMHGLEHHLIQEGYFYLLASHQSKGDLLEEYLNLLQDRLVEGFILLAAKIEKPPRLPTVVVSGHRRIEGVTNVVLDEAVGARQGLRHLVELGHERIVFFWGPPSNADAIHRRAAVEKVAAEMSIQVRPELSFQTTGITYGEIFYEEGYTRGRELLASGEPFTALYAFNDFSAIGAMKAFFEAGLRVPEDVSVIGFDDIQSAAFFHPSLTTVRQPLREIGETASRVLLERLAGGASLAEVVVEPELVVRSSTGPAPRPRRG